MLDRRYAEALLDQPDFRVLGRRLRPFSLYHYFGLELIQSPFLYGETGATAIDLELASRVCSAGYRDLSRSLNRDGLWQQLRWLFILRTCDFNREAEIFSRYLHAHLALPQFWKKETSQSSAIPLPLSLAASLLRHTNLDEEAVWMMPFARAYWYVTAFTVQDGLSPDLVTPEEESIFETVPPTGGSDGGN